MKLIKDEELSNREVNIKLTEGLAIKFILIKFAEFIKSEYTLCTDYGGMFSSELTENKPGAEDLVNRFLKEQVEGINKEE